MELQLNTTIHHNTIRRAFFHYSALTAYTYNFNCYRCGHDPAVLISDANWKLAIDLPCMSMLSWVFLKLKYNKIIVDLQLNLRYWTEFKFIVLAEIIESCFIISKWVCWRGLIIKMWDTIYLSTFLTSGSDWKRNSLLMASVKVCYHIFVFSLVFLII